MDYRLTIISYLDSLCVYIIIDHMLHVYLDYSITYKSLL